MPEELNAVEKATFQDLIDGNACIGPDGGIWYPSGPADVPVANIFMALVNEARSHRCKEEQCRDRELVWTEEPPKVPGVYLVRHLSESSKLDVIDTMRISPSYVAIFPVLEGVQWAGPIDMPKENEK